MPGRDRWIAPFAFGYTPDEFAATHRAIVDGAWDLEPMITGRVGVDGVPGAFQALGDPDQHVPG